MVRVSVAGPATMAIAAVALQGVKGIDISAMLGPQRLDGEHLNPGIAGLVETGVADV